MRKTLSILIFIVSVGLSIAWVVLPSSLIDYGNFFYWIFLVLVTLFNILSKKDSGRFLYTAFYLTIAGALISSIGQLDAADRLLRLSLIIWLFGILKLLRELRLK